MSMTDWLNQSENEDAEDEEYIVSSGICDAELLAPPANILTSRITVYLIVCFVVF